MKVKIIIFLLILGFLPHWNVKNKIQLTTTGKAVMEVTFSDPNPDFLFKFHRRALLKRAGFSRISDWKTGNTRHVWGSKLFYYGDDWYKIASDMFVNFSAGENESALEKEYGYEALIGKYDAKSVLYAKISPEIRKKLNSEYITFSIEAPGRITDTNGYKAKHNLVRFRYTSLQWATGQKKIYAKVSVRKTDPTLNPFTNAKEKMETIEQKQSELEVEVRAAKKELKKEKSANKYKQWNLEQNDKKLLSYARQCLRTFRKIRRQAPVNLTELTNFMEDNGLGNLPPPSAGRYKYENGYIYIGK